MIARPSPSDIESWLDRLYVHAEGATLRDEDRKKAAELAALLPEIARATSGPAPVLVDAAAGKAYVGLIAAKLVLEPRGARGRVVTIERDPARAAQSRAAAALLDLRGIEVTCLVGDVADRALWPGEPTCVVALHACGPAADAVLAQAVATRARHLLVVPCCTQDDELAPALAETLGVPRHAGVRRRFVEAILDAERVLRLEAAGWQTEAVEFVSPAVTPHNLLLRARRAGEPTRMCEAAARLERLRLAARV